MFPTADIATVPIDTTLNTFIRLNAQLSGTKFMCLEGGCGVCLVSVKQLNPTTGNIQITAVNSVSINTTNIAIVRAKPEKIQLVSTVP